MTITNAATDTVVDALTTTAEAGTWSTTLTSAQAEALANGSYTVSAGVSDSSGNAATPATQTVTSTPESVDTIMLPPPWNGRWRPETEPSSEYPHGAFERPASKSWTGTAVAIGSAFVSHREEGRGSDGASGARSSMCSDAP